METESLAKRLKEITCHLDRRARNVIREAVEYSIDLLQRVHDVSKDYLERAQIQREDVCLVAIGSVGRLEALQASDLDIIPILKDQTALEEFTTHDQRLRELLNEELNLKISKGEDLTKCTHVNELTTAEAIGGDRDNSATLTKRILILTEGQQAGGKLSLQEIRRNILNAYAGAERTRGRHVLSLCNDLARYYRTLCIEYKAKVDVHDKDWCTRNIKLRHSRKFWYFSLIMAIVNLSATHPEGEEEYIKGLLAAFEIPPYLRIFEAIGKKHGIVVRDLMEHYTGYLSFMSNMDHRDALGKIEHSQRYGANLHNPFPQMKLNSDLLGVDMLRIIDGLPNYLRERVFEWFLL